MAEIQTHILDAALRQGFITPSGYLHPDEQLFVAPSVVTAMERIALIREAGDNGLDVAQLTHRSGLNENTVKTYLRWIRANELVEWEREVGQGRKLICYGIKHTNAENLLA